jgi:hypothetical protein
MTMINLRQAYLDYRRSREGEISPKSLHWTDQKVRLQLVDLLDTPLDQITPRLCRDLHEHLSRTSGRYSAKDRSVDVQQEEAAILEALSAELAWVESLAELAEGRMH